MLPDLPQTEVAIVELTNAFRKTKDLQELKPNPVLGAAARAFADYLARTGGKLSHEADGRQPQDRALAAGYKYCLVAENLASNLDSRGFSTRQLAQEVVEGWKGSPLHREAMLLPLATEIGVAVVQAPAKHPKFISVQLFGRPESAQVRYTIQNLSRTPVRYTLGTDTETLKRDELVTHTDCEPRALKFEGVGISTSYMPKTGDWFTLKPGKQRAIEVELKSEP